MASSSPGALRASASGWLLGLATFGLFLVWSNSFVAISYLLGADREAARFDWVTLTIARFLPVAPICALYCFGWHRRESLAALRTHWKRLVPCGLLGVPAYNLALFYGQQHGVPAPIASLTTALLPLIVLVLAALFLGERLTRRRVAGFLISVAGMSLVALSRREAGGDLYLIAVLVTIGAPLSWSLYSVISKPATGAVRPLLWTYLAVTIGSVALLPFVPVAAGRLGSLDAPGWAALLYLSWPCTVLGYAVWTWLLEHLPASTVGLTVFLNPPLTTVSKLVLAAVLPGVFVFSVTGQELVGGVLALVGLAVAVGGRRK